MDETRSEAFLRALRTGPVLCDGAMGSLLAASVSAAAAADGEPPVPIEYLVPEELNARAPECVLTIHRAYAAAGAQVLETNSFGGNPIKLAAAGLADCAWDLNVRAARLARRAADGRRGDAAIPRRSGVAGAHPASPRPRVSPSPVWVAGSMGPTGQLLAPYGDLSFGASRAAFAEQATALAEGGADFLLIETMVDLAEAQAALVGAAATGLPVVVTLAFEPHGRTMMGVTPEDAIRVLAAAGAVAVGANCGQGPKTVVAVVRRLHGAASDVPLVAQPNAGLPRLEQGAVRYDCAPEALAAYTPAFLEAGVRLLGSCCGSTPAHTAALAAALTAAPATAR